MAEEVRPVWTVDGPLEGQIACDTLREHGIRCDCVEMASDDARTDPGRYITAAGGGSRAVLTVIVAPEDVERAHDVLEKYTDLP